MQGENNCSRARETFISDTIDEVSLDFAHLASSGLNSHSWAFDGAPNDVDLDQIVLFVDFW